LDRNALAGLKFTMQQNINIRQIDRDSDLALLEDFSAVFITDRIFRIQINGLNAAFEEEALPEPLLKRYDISGIGVALNESDLGLIAEIEGKIAGFMTVKVESWNRRAWITHLYVRDEHKGQGIGRRFVDEAANFARAREARGLWLETQNFNYPAIQFYLRLGFRFCGFDESLYDPSVVPGETAMYFSRDL
jgi:ribosomal protein S18 acetylase RimI-like enzyme